MVDHDDYDDLHGSDSTDYSFLWQRKYKEWEDPPTLNSQVPKKNSF